MNGCEPIPRTPIQLLKQIPKQQLLKQEICLFLSQVITSGNLSEFMWIRHRIQPFSILLFWPLQHETSSYVLTWLFQLMSEFQLMRKRKERWRRGGNVPFVLVACNRNCTDQILSEFIAQLNQVAALSFRTAVQYHLYLGSCVHS